MKGTWVEDALGEAERDLDLDLLILLGDLELEFDLRGDLECDLWRDRGGVLCVNKMAEAILFWMLNTRVERPVILLAYNGIQQSIPDPVWYVYTCTLSIQ